MAGRFRFVAASILAVGIVAGVAFGVGVKYGHDHAPQTSGGLTAQQVLSLVGGTGTGASTQGGTGGLPTGIPGANIPSGAPSALAGLTTGRITSVQGQTLTVEIRAGTSMKVNLGGSVAVSRYSGGAISDLKEGSTILIQGTRGSDGAVNASSVALIPGDLATILGNLTAPFSGGATPPTLPTGVPSVAITPGAGNPPAPPSNR